MAYKCARHDTYNYTESRDAEVASIHMYLYIYMYMYNYTHVSPREFGIAMKRENARYAGYVEEDGKSRS